MRSKAWNHCIMTKTVQVLGLIVVFLLHFTSCTKPIPYTVVMEDGLQVRIQQMVTGQEAETILKSFPNHDWQIPEDQEFLILKLNMKNGSSQVVNVPFLYFLQVDTKSETPTTLQIYFKDEFEMPEEGTWKKLTRLERIQPNGMREGTICFVVPKNVILKRFYIYQTYLTFPEGFVPSDIK
jgi:hypothetical protein